MKTNRFGALAVALTLTLGMTAPAQAQQSATIEARTAPGGFRRQRRFASDASG